eukprot:4862937-Amphidinium_carterae.1
MLAQSEWIQIAVTSIHLFQQKGTSVTKRSTTLQQWERKFSKGIRKPWNRGWYNNCKKGAGKKGGSRPQVFNIADNTERWHQEPNNTQFQACSSTQQPRGTPSQPIQSQMGRLYNDTLYRIGAGINVNERMPTTYKESASGWTSICG